jgi:hypothetical protein
MKIAAEEVCQIAKKAFREGSRRHAVRNVGVKISESNAVRPDGSHDILPTSREQKGRGFVELSTLIDCRGFSRKCFQIDRPFAWHIISARNVQADIHVQSKTSFLSTAFSVFAVSLYVVYKVVQI